MIAHIRHLLIACSLRGGHTAAAIHIKHPILLLVSICVRYLIKDIDKVKPSTTLLSGGCQWGCGRGQVICMGPICCCRWVLGTLCKFSCGGLNRWSDGCNRLTNGWLDTWLRSPGLVELRHGRLFEYHVLLVDWWSVRGLEWAQLFAFVRELGRYILISYSVRPTAKIDKCLASSPINHTAKYTRVRIENQLKGQALMSCVELYGWQSYLLLIMLSSCSYPIGLFIWTIMDGADLLILRPQSWVIPAWCEWSYPTRISIRSLNPSQHHLWQ